LSHGEIECHPADRIAVGRGTVDDLAPSGGIGHHESRSIVPFQIPGETPMKAILVRWSVPALVTLCVLGANAMPAEETGKPVAHMVFFSLKDRSEEARRRFVDSCHKYLADIEGTTYFSVGTIAEDLEEPVSVKDFDVALHVVFKDKATKEAYLVHPQHQRFVEENRPHFAKVRVFDSYLTKTSE
jgi:hypothetical protein